MNMKREERERGGGQVEDEGEVDRWRREWRRGDRREEKK